MSFAPKRAMIVNNHSLLAIRTSDVEGNISAYLLDNEPSDPRRPCCRLSPSAPMCRRRQSLDPPLHRIEMGPARSDDWLPRRRRHCVLHADGDGVIVAAVLSVLQHNVSHVDVGERMTTSKNGRQKIFCRNIFVENNADVVVRQKQHGPQSNTIRLASRRSRQDRLLTIFKSSLKIRHVCFGY